MIKNFSDFNTENLLESLLLESKIEFSDKFVSILNQTDNKIASELISIMSKDFDKDFPQNYIDIGDLKDEATFISNTKAKEILGKDKIKYRVTMGNRHLGNRPRNEAIFRRLGYEPEGEAHNPMGSIGTIESETISKSTGRIYVLFVSDDGRKSVINKSALAQVNDDSNIEALWTKNRNPIKIGRLVRSILTTSKITFTSKEIEDFVNSYKSTYDLIKNALLKFKLVKGSEIEYWYNRGNYEGYGRSTLGNSCMSEADSSYFDIYSNNNNCSLLILFSNNGEIVDGEYKSDKIVGRALVWNTDQGDTFIDRIYTNDDSDVDLFKKYAEDKGWWYKSTQNSNTGFNASNGKTSKEAKYSVSLEKTRFEHYPYLDSFPYINFDEKKISNMYSGLITPQAELDSTSGYMSTIRDFDPWWAEGDYDDDDY